MDPEETPVVQEPKKIAVQTLLGEVGDAIKASGPQVYSALKTAMVKREIDDRVALLDKAIQKRSKDRAELRTIERPDNETFDAEGKSLPGTYSKGRVEAIKKLREPLQKLESALEKALTDNDWTKLKEIVK